MNPLRIEQVLLFSIFNSNLPTYVDFRYLIFKKVIVRTKEKHLNVTMVQNKLIYPYVRFEMDIGYGNQLIGY